MKLILAIVLGFFLQVQSLKNDLLHITVASKETDGYNRFMRSARVYGIEPKVLGLGKEWLGGALANGFGGGYKINLLREELEKHKDNEELVVLFTDSYDVILTSGKEELLKKFRSFEANIVFGAEDFCWPDSDLKDDYPSVLLGYQFLNSGGFIGYASHVYNMLKQEVKNTDDDQLYYTKVFLNNTVSMRIKLDNLAKIFQNLNGNLEDVALEFEEDDTRLINNVYKTTPVVIHGNGPTKVNLNTMGNYLAQSWFSSGGCLDCDKGRIDPAQIMEKKVLMGIYVSKPTPFLQEMLQKVSQLTHPKAKIHLLVYNSVVSHEELVKKWVDEQRKEGYAEIKYISSNEKIKIWGAKEIAIEKCLAVSCDVYFNVESEVHLDRPDILSLLISYNRSILAPVMTRVNKLWSTFWGAVTADGYYARSSDYADIVNRQRKGIWNVPYIYGVYIIWSHILTDPETRPKFIRKLLDEDISMTANFRDQGVFMYAVNLEDNYGHLISNEAVSTEHLHNDLWQVAANPFDWGLKYLHPGYFDVLEPTSVLEMPCNDVYWLPLFSEQFCSELIETMEHFGQWSGGKYQDKRLSGGYENVPTDDIHMNQVGYEQEWLFILKEYIKPMAERVFTGYNSDARSLMNFVVKYHPSRQYFLRPHHDSSTYTINVGLNRPNIDYKGGGAKFIRQNCSVTDTKVGWTLLHPGRLTHFHEGLPTTEGTRYILVSFIDP